VIASARAVQARQSLRRESGKPDDCFGNGPAGQMVASATIRHARWTGNLRAPDPTRSASADMVNGWAGASGHRQRVHRKMARSGCPQSSEPDYRDYHLRAVVNGAGEEGSIDDRDGRKAAVIEERSQRGRRHLQTPNPPMDSAARVSGSCAHTVRTNGKARFGDRPGSRIACFGRRDPDHQSSGFGSCSHALSRRPQGRRRNETPTSPTRPDGAVQADPKDRGG